jgi:hypothetical protein
VSPISKSAGAFKRTARVENARPAAGLETRDTADLEVNACQVKHSGFGEKGGCSVEAEFAQASFSQFTFALRGQP